MIALAAVLIFENVDNRASEVSLQALLPLPAESTAETAAYEVLADVLPRQIEGYSRRDVLNVTGGHPIRCVLEPDHFRIVLTLPPANVSEGLGLLQALLTRSHISDAMVDEAVAARKPPTYWGAALRPRELDVRSIRGREIVELYEQITAKDTLRIAIGGPFQPAQVREVWGKKEAAWPAPKYIARSPFPPSGRIRPRNPGGVTTLEFAGPTFAADDAALPTRLLALVALGSGKGSSLFRVARGELALSYRQEALLAPSPKGWQPRLILAMRPRADEVEVVSTLRTALLSDVERWSEAHRLRAVGMADLSLTRATELSPLSLWRTGPVPNNLEGRTFLKAYWPMKTGQAWNPERLADATRNVTLADLKAAAHELLEQANVTLLTGASGATPQTPRDDDRGEGSRTSGTRP